MPSSSVRVIPPEGRFAGQEAAAGVEQQPVGPRLRPIDGDLPIAGQAVDVPVATRQHPKVRVPGRPFPADTPFGLDFQGRFRIKDVVRPNGRADEQSEKRDSRGSHVGLRNKSRPPQHTDRGDVEAEESWVSDLVFRLDRATIVRPTGETVFRDLSWEIRAGQTWAVVGPVGSGKTALTDVLLVNSA